MTIKHVRPLAAALLVLQGCAAPGPPPATPGAASTGAAAPAPEAWERVATVADVWRHYPERVRGLLAALDLARPDLGAVRAAALAGDTVAAAEALLAHYRHGASGHWLRAAPAERDRQSAGGGGLLRDADQVMADTFTFQDVTSRVPRLENGAIRWDFLGPHQDREFGYFLNRHGPFVTLLNAWRESRNPAYVRAFDRLARDWVVHNPVPESGPPAGAIQWRTLETGLRMAVSWPQAFYGFLGAQEFSPAARLLMLSSISEHGEFLYRHHRTGHNWAVMEMNGLALIALVFPEFARADEWYRHAAEQLRRELASTVYPDGVLHELTTHYHIVALRNFEMFARNSRLAGRPVPEEFAGTLEAMNEYLARSVRPTGHIPLDNDGDRDDVRPRLLAAAEQYARPDWRFVATNGREGRRPEGLASAVFPWSGRVIMRSGWDADAHWSFFDAGPWGSTHQHDDMLHLSVAAFGRDLLVDAGRFHYTGDRWREYFVSSAAHNVVLVDGRGQSREWGRANMVAKQPMEPHSYRLTPDFDYARATFPGEFQGVEGRTPHTRAVFYVKDRFWVVVDRVSADRPRRLEALWHFHPGCTVVLDGGSAVSTDAGQGNLRVVPVGDVNWSVDMVEGQEQPHIQGWYSESYNHREPNPTAVYAAQVQGAATFAWVLLPARGAVPRVQATLRDDGRDAVRVRVEEAGRPPVEVVVPLEAGAEPRLIDRGP